MVWQAALAPLVAAAQEAQPWLALAAVEAAEEGHKQETAE
jgi:hypothetical protein